MHPNVLWPWGHRLKTGQRPQLWLMKTSGLSVLQTRLLLEVHPHLLFRLEITVSRADTFAERNGCAGHEEHHIARRIGHIASNSP
jgi:hypothetical protein